jgi:plastocyanin
VPRKTIVTLFRLDWKFAAALPLIAALAAVVTHGVVAQAPASTVVAQKDISFSPARVELKAGSTLTFVNEDPFGHNVYSETKGGEFDIGRQQPGQRSVVTFRQAGTFIAECRIHPKMRLEIVVTP